MHLTVVAVALLGFLSGSALAQDPVKISVYYESLCPDSKKFITTQLWPTYQLIPEIIKVDFVPFGRANYSVSGTGWDFTCEHGPRECEGNKIHSCALTYHPANTETVPFIYCSMNGEDPVLACQGCGEAGQLNWPQIETCAYSDVGSALLVGNGERTYSLNPPLGFVPWIAINDVHTDDIQNQGFSDLLNLVCATYQGTPPAACQTQRKH